MPIWKLTPIARTAPEWHGTSPPDKVIVRAANAHLARHVVLHDYGAIEGSRETVHSPWLSEAVVHCARLEGSQYEDDGVPAVLCLTEMR